MCRQIITTDDEALSDLPTTLVRPAWLSRESQLPFPLLSGDEFEILCYLLLRRMNPGDKLYYYGKSSDMGRDIMHHCADGRLRLIQCKNYSDKLSPSAVGAEMAKVFANVHNGKIPKKPNEVVFYVSSDLSAQSQDLIESQDEWRKDSERYLKTYLKASPSDEIRTFAHTWWPFGDRQSGLAITEDVRQHYPELIDQFFEVRNVIDGTIEGHSECFQRGDTRNR